VQLLCKKLTELQIFEERKKAIKKIEKQNQKTENIFNQY
jgi:hypothetical protein